MVGRERKVETRFARRASAGKGVGIDEAVAAAERRIDDMRETATAQIGDIIFAMQALRPAVTAGSVNAAKSLYAQADVLVGVCKLFGQAEIGEAAFSMCQLFDMCSPGCPTPEAVTVHLDALKLFWSVSPEVRASTAPQVLEGLRKVSSAVRTAFPAP